MRFYKPVIIVIAILLLFSAGLAAEPARISVLYFHNTSGAEELKWLEKGLADMLLTDLALSDEIQGIEREELEKIISEQKFSMSGMADEEQSIEIGRLLSAEYLLTGSFLTSGGRLRIDCKLLDAETGELKTAVKSEGSRDSVFEMEAELARGVFRGLDLDIPEGIIDSKPESVDAVRSYYTGLDFFDKGRYAEALEFYRQAAIEAPKYSKPRAGIEESYKFLKDFRSMRRQREINQLLTKANILRNRLEREPWMTYADFIMDAYSKGITDNTELNRMAEELGLMSGETPAVCAWNLQNTLMEIADLSMEYFEDQELAEYSNAEIIAIAVEARRIWAGDPFLPELIYQELLVSYFQDRWTDSLTLCEELMINYPDYRMMWAVEDFYENSLAELENAE